MRFLLMQNNTLTSHVLVYARRALRNTICTSGENQNFILQIELIPPNKNFRNNFLCYM